jgi:glycosyltransferase involved in cell wall biosynthesis
MDAPATNCCEKPILLMRIGLDVHVLTGPHQGTTSVWLNLLSELPPTHEYVLYSFDPYAVRRRFPQRHFIHRRIPRIPAAARIQIAFPFMTRRDGCDVFHANYYGPIVGGPPLVLQVHDLIYLDFPEYSTGMRTAMFETLSRASARAAKRVVTDSHWSKERIIAHYHLSPDRIDVVPLGLDRSWACPSEPAIESAWDQLRSRVPARFALSVGRLDPRKNFAQTARVVRRLVDRGELDGLVIVGPEDFGATRIRAEMERDGTAGIVTHLSALDTASLQALYRHARCLLYLSLAEGFGLPLIEAMSMGTPIVASNRTSIPEVVGDAGLIVDPEDSEQVVRALADVLSSPELRDSMIARGKARAKQFDGTVAASRMIDVYAAAAASRRTPGKRSR